VQIDLVYPDLLAELATTPGVEAVAA